MADKYEPPQAIRLTDNDRGFGACNTQGSTLTGYRVNGFAGNCVTGKSATDGCYAGVGCASGSAG
jgi:hypothetical protein